MVHLSVTPPEFVDLAGRRTAFVDLPQGTQDALLKSIRENSLGSQLVSFDPFLVTGDVSGINNELNAIGRLDPRKASKIRTQLIKEGVKGTSLTLGAVSPQFIQALEFQKSIQNFPEQRESIQRDINLLKSEGRVATVNTSDLTNFEARQRADLIFRKQQGTTLAVSSQVSSVLGSAEFKEIQARGGSHEELANLLNNQGVTFSKSTASIINELSQADIQGESQTAQNIQNILQREGVTTSVIVNIDESPLGASFQTSPSASLVTQPIQTIISTIPSLAGIQTFTPEGEPIVQGFPPSQQTLTSGAVSGGAGGIVSAIGESVDSILGTGINPLILGILAIIIPIILVAVFI